MRLLFLLWATLASAQTHLTLTLDCPPVGPCAVTVVAPSITVTSTTTTSTVAAKSIETSGYLGTYDPATIPVWPQRLGIMLGEANAQGPLVAPAKIAAAAAGNTSARFLFYFSLTSLDSKCGCSDAAFYASFITTHPEWVLHDAAGNKVSTFVTELGAARQFAVDIGNLAFVDAWADWALAAMSKYGWDGVWADNILRGNFANWSAPPIDPSTHAVYTQAQYRADMLAALQRIKARFGAKLLVGNHASAWDPPTFADPVVQQQVLAMDGVEIEDCVYDFNGNPQSVANWTAQLAYLDFANQHGVLTQCRGGNGTLGDPAKRDYILASYLLTKQGHSNVGQLNALGMWWPGLAVDLGAPVGHFIAGPTYARQFTKGRVSVNPVTHTGVVTVVP